jgi:hypothetical protein
MSRLALCRSASLCLVVSFAATTAEATNYTRSYLVDNVLLPTSNTLAADYAIDVDGDGHVDNSFGQILSALAAQGIDFNGLMGLAIASGSVVHLVHVQSTDALLVNDPAAQATWCIGVPTATPPLFDGTDNPSCADTSGIFVAALSGGSFTSSSPATTANPVSLDIELAFATYNATFPVLNARLSFMKNSAGNMPFGQINGSIPHSNVMSTFPPAMAALCNDAIQSDPSSSTATTCKSLFDTGCAGFPGYANDGQIELCEITENSLVAALLAPDVEVADGGVTVPANSIGFRFTAIGYDRVFASSFEP